MSLRDRRRATATREILDAAHQQIVERGPAGLALRAVARDLGMTVQALYHYFPNRDELVTALIVEAYDDLTATVRAAVDHPARPGDPAFIAAAEGFRGWAIDHAARFQLIYGTPLRHYRAPDDGRTTGAAQRLALVICDALFAGLSADRLSRMELPPMSAGLRERFDRLPAEAIGAFPPAAGALFVSVWGHLHGLVVLEAFGHTDFLAPFQAEIFRGAMRDLLAGVHRRLPD